MRQIKFILLVVGLCFTTSVWAQCFINVIPVNFGSFDNLNAPVDANGQVGVRCDLPAQVSIQLDAGVNSTGLFQQRKLSASVSQKLNYNLYVDSARVLVWGDGTGGTQTVSGTAGSNWLNFPIYGRINSGQTGSVGTYVDTITVSVIW